MLTQAPIKDPAALTRFIEDRYHARHRQQLPELVQLASRVESEHFGDHNAPQGLADVLDGLGGEMEAHMRKEELVLFPMIRLGEVKEFAKLMVEMRADHDGHAHEITYIRALTNDLRTPSQVYRTWAALYDGLRRFVADLQEHIRLEDEVLFPPFEIGR
ncbi:regulator [Defluviimonas sp. 20V17]|uniref:Regulator of cell morphogenesis and NO signaling n=1 Tax=Allgaiera indica TaxID=765699 RepID=A0AAN4UUX1_9RHOB|nr:hemerythrin domain-containing protein [Allgaiera indica]KDB04377.1 regulator [Defluviimonas sp. 20V17]GHE06051.1 hypothetical protein GCM10008024_39170 [Allgaiera indica]SDX83917.1 regulator of cell morphogenesis and NO signaling [Allgaiera indica]